MALVAAFATRADLLLLDEPTSGLDPLIEAEFVRSVREVAAEGRTVFLSSHILSEVETLCARVGILREGKLEPSWTAGVVGGLAVGLYMIELIGPALSWPAWILDLSPCHHLALVPVESAAWVALWSLVGAAVVSGGVGLLAYARRDLR
ncbi:MAG: AAA family ATPase [Micromonosporaceae bacterium]